MQLTGASFDRTGSHPRRWVRGSLLRLLIGLLLVAVAAACAAPGALEMEKARLVRHVRSHPGDGDAWVNLGITYCRMKEYPSAVAALRKALKIDPRNADALYNLGMCFHRMGKYDKAVRQYRRLRLIDPDLADKLFKVLNAA